MDLMYKFGSDYVIWTLLLKITLKKEIQHQSRQLHQKFFIFWIYLQRDESHKEIPKIIQIFINMLRLIKHKINTVMFFIFHAAYILVLVFFLFVNIYLYIFCLLVRAINFLLYSRYISCSHLNEPLSRGKDSIELAKVGNKCN